jgi:hypothetical protein
MAARAKADRLFTVETGQASPCCLLQSLPESTKRDRRLPCAGHKFCRKTYREKKDIMIAPEAMIGRQMIAFGG